MARLPSAALALALLATAPASAEPILVDLVVARVDGRPILLSELRPRLRQLEQQLATQTPPPEAGSRIEQLSWRTDPRSVRPARTARAKPRQPVRSAGAERGRAREALLERAIDEALIATRARQLAIQVGPAEVETALASIAAQNALDVPGILAQAAEVGLSEKEYRAEVRRQLLEQRVLLAEISRRNLGWPKDQRAVSAWLAAENRALVRRLRRDACVERRVRW